MKKRLMVMMCSLMMVFGMSQCVMADVSPEGEKITTETEDKTSTAPKTGEGDMVIYTIAAAAVLSGTVVVSRKRLAKEN